MDTNPSRPLFKRIETWIAIAATAVIVTLIVLTQPNPEHSMHISSQQTKTVEQEVETWTSVVNPHTIQSWEDLGKTIVLIGETYRIRNSYLEQHKTSEQEKLSDELAAQSKEKLKDLITSDFNTFKTRVKIAIYDEKYWTEEEKKLARDWERELNALQAAIDKKYEAFEEKNEMLAAEDQKRLREVYETLSGKQ